MPPTAAELVSVINSNGFLTVDEFRIKVKIKDARTVFGRTDYLVEPIEGEGEKWVSSERVSVSE